MKIICLFNGLGNQMSQYAFYLSQAENQKVLYSTYYMRRRIKDHNGYELYKLFNIPDQRHFLLDLFIRFIRKLEIFENKPHTNKFVLFVFKILNIIGIKIIKERKDYCFDKNNLLPCKGIGIYIGGWHSEKYFKTKEQLIRNTFQFDQSLLNRLSSKYLEKIMSENSISVHIRRGDFLSAYHSKIYGNVCSLSYYNKAIKLITDKIANPSFYVFSNDISWIKENLTIPNPTYVEHNTNEDSWQDMYLMSQCKHHIIANSTFSWWGAWLGENKNKMVVAPDRFVSTKETPDIFPEEWIKINIENNFTDEIN